LFNPFCIVERELILKKKLGSSSNGIDNSMLSDVCLFLGPVCNFTNHDYEKFSREYNTLCYMDYYCNSYNDSGRSSYHFQVWMKLHSRLLCAI
jgi:hypothetical protein